MHVLIVSECQIHPARSDGSRGRAYTIRSSDGDEVHCCGEWDFSPDLDLGSYPLQLDEVHATLGLDARSHVPGRSRPAQPIAS